MDDRMSPRGSGASTESMSAAHVTSRAALAHSLLDIARLASQFSDDVGAEAAANGIASNAVLAGIAAADAICGKALGFRSSSQSHGDAVAMLKRAHGGEAASNHLKALISVKSAAAYEPLIITSAKAAEALQHAERLVAAMDALLS